TLNDWPLWPNTAPGELVGRADAMDFLYSGEHLQIARIKVHASAHGSQHRLASAGGAMHRKAHPDQVFDHLLDLLIGRGFLHGNDHKVSRSSSVVRRSPKRLHLVRRIVL